MSVTMMNRRAFVVASLCSIGVAACGQTIADSVDDSTITARVRTTLLNDGQLDARRIDVTTVGGVVTLQGTVSSSGDETRAVGLARQIRGVRDVRSALSVS